MLVLGGSYFQSFARCHIYWLLPADSGLTNRIARSRAPSKKFIRCKRESPKLSIFVRGSRHGDVEVCWFTPPTGFGHKSFATQLRVFLVALMALTGTRPGLYYGQWAMSEEHVRHPWMDPTWWKGSSRAFCYFILYSFLLYWSHTSEETSNKTTCTEVRAKHSAGATCQCVCPPFAADKQNRKCRQSVKTNRYRFLLQEFLRCEWWSQRSNPSLDRDNDFVKKAGKGNNLSCVPRRIIPRCGPSLQRSSGRNLFFEANENEEQIGGESVKLGFMSLESLDSSITYHNQGTMRRHNEMSLQIQIFSRGGYRRGVD